MLKVYISRNATHGISRVVEAQYKYLPIYGVDPTETLKDAAVIANHGSSVAIDGTKPIVHHGHGLYWSRYDWGHNYQEANAQVINSMCHAVAHTAPSEWVAISLRRLGFFYPEVIYHGVDIEDWPVVDEPRNYVLWNKARHDLVSNPIDMNKVAHRLPSIPFVATVNEKKLLREPLGRDWIPGLPNIKTLPPVSYDEMKSMVAHAGVYLATARETFGIGTLEAMACGVPIAGWDWGGQREIIRQGETGYLATPGNYEQLAECIVRCLEERERLGKNARQDVINRWGWKHRIAQYAELYKEVNRYYSKKRPKVSVVITTHNLDKYLPDCIRSVQSQNVKDTEILVIDDAQSESTERLVGTFSEDDRRIKYIPTPENLGLPGARNYGVSRSKSLYIRFCDADDMLAENCLSLESDALDKNPGLHIAYGHLGMIHENGEPFLDQHGEPKRSDWPMSKFSWRQQMAHMNQIPSCAMIRREVFERGGGYRDRMKRQEDAEFWCRMTSMGFRAAKVTDAVTFLHRHRPDSKGEIEWREQGSEPDWTLWFPWRMGAGNIEDGKRLYMRYRESHPNAHLVPAAAQGKPPSSLRSWYANDYSYPKVSVVIPVGPGHEKHLVNALDSVQAQSYPDWECIVVNDTGKKWEDTIPGAPWARIVDTNGNKGVAYARNVGIANSKAELIATLDADDIWLSWFLEKTVAMYESNDGIVYTNMLEFIQGEELPRTYDYPEFDCERVVKGMVYPGSSILIPRWVHEKVVAMQGGYDVHIPGMEDWDYQIACHVVGACAYRVAEPCFVYRTKTGYNRDRDYANIEAIVNYINKKWKALRKGEKEMACGCSKKKKPSELPVSTMSSSGQFTTEDIMKLDMSTAVDSSIELKYVGERSEPFSIRSKVDRSVIYKFSNNGFHQVKKVFAGDAQWMLQDLDVERRPKWEIVKTESPPAKGNPVASIAGMSL